MKNSFVIGGLALLLGCAGVANDTASEGAKGLEWLSATWTNDHDGQWSEERWSNAKGKMMIGTGRSGSGDELQSFEYLRIMTEDDGSLTYVAAPGGGDATEFALAEAAANSAIFENAEHDFPQRISYRREGDTLFVEISAIDGSNAIAWEMQKAD